MIFKKKNTIVARTFIQTFFFLFISFTSLSQSQADSLKNIWSDVHQSSKKRFETYDRYFSLLIESNPNAIIESSESHLNLAKKVSSKQEIIKALSCKTNAYYLMGQSKEALETLEIQYYFAKKFKNNIALAKNLANRGVIYELQCNYREAVRVFIQALTVFRKIKSTKDEAIVLNNIGNIFTMIDDHKHALIYYEKSLAVYQKMGVEDDIVWIGLTESAIDLGDYIKGQKYNQKTFNLVQKNNNKFGIAKSYYLFSRIEMAVGNNAKAIEFAKKSLTISSEIGVEQEIIKYKLQLGKLLLKKNITEATKISESVLELVNERTNIENFLQLYNLLYKCYKIQNKTKLSLEMLEKYNIYNERLTKQKKDFNIIREVIKSEFATELQEASNENAAKLKTLKRKQASRVFIIIGISIIFFLYLFFFYRKRMALSQKERNHLLEEIEAIKTQQNESNATLESSEFKLDRDKIETAVNKKLNETDWNVLNIIYEDPVIANKDIAEKAFLSVDGIGSSLRRMYEVFEIKESKYKKISLIHEVVRISK